MFNMLITYMATTQDMQLKIIFTSLKCELMWVNNQFSYMAIDI